MILFLVKSKNVLFGFCEIDIKIVPTSDLNNAVSDLFTCSALFVFICKSQVEVVEF